MTVPRFAALLFVALTWLPASVHADPRIESLGPLHGLDKLAIETAALPGDDARRCGVKRVDLTAAAGPPMSNVGIDIGARGEPSVYHVRITINFANGQCTAFVASELLLTMVLYLPHMGPANESYLPTSTVRLWSAGELVIRPAESFAPYVRDLVARQSEAFAAQWEDENTEG